MQLKNYLRNLPKRNHVGIQMHRTLTSYDIRRQFLNYFIKNNHSFIRSSPVVPFCDPTVAFVNAGMNQFKNVFLGKRPAPCTRAVNSQKCVRVGGKHNDLSIVGTDGYHHTFFEMLGNWSFGDYFKKDACELAWNLLTGPYQINTSRLYVTYFGGDANLQLQPDYECKDIWRSLGVSEDRILPFGTNENFWEMGATCPCGPCTEIHIDHLPNSNPAFRASRVNAGFSDLTELWNVVFIEYNRNADGSMSSLPMKHIDTGMGMERLVAVLQDKPSNYETDLFRPIIDPTDSTSKYCYEYNETTKDFIVPNIVARILNIICHDNGIIDVLVDKTNFYYESGGQAADVGQIVHPNGIFDVKSVSSVNGQVVHSGEFVNGRFETNDLVELVVDGARRTSNIRNHTASHLLNASVKQITKCLTYQRSSSVTSSRLKLDLGILGYKPECSSIKEIEKLVG